MFDYACLHSQVSHAFCACVTKLGTGSMWASGARYTIFRDAIKAYTYMKKIAKPNEHEVRDCDELHMRYYGVLCISTSLESTWSWLPEFHVSIPVPDT